MDMLADLSVSLFLPRCYVSPSSAAGHESLGSSLGFWTPQRSAKREQLRVVGPPLEFGDHATSTHKSFLHFNIAYLSKIVWTGSWVLTRAFGTIKSPELARADRKLPESGKILSSNTMRESSI